MKTLYKKFKTTGELSFPMENITLNSKQFQFEVSKLVSSFNNLGVNASSAVLLNLVNGSDFCIYLFAAWEIGATVIPVSPQGSDVNWIKNNLKPNFEISKNGFMDLQNTSQFEEDIALILFTSGSTGNPKGVPITFSQIDEKISAMGEVFPLQEFHNTLCFLPLSFGHGLISNFLFPFFWGCNVLVADFNNLEFVVSFNELIEKYKISFFSTVPSTLRMILNLNKNAMASLQNLKRIHCASANLSTSLISEVNKLYPAVPLYNLYGITEQLSWICIENTTTNNYQSGCVGSPLFGLIQIEEIEGLDPGVGEVLIKNSFQVDKYIFNIESDRWKNGWFKSGDLGFFDSSNKLYIVGRTDDLINTGGSKFYPIEVDNILLASNLLVEAVTTSKLIDGVVKIISFIVPINPDVFSLSSFISQVGNSVEARRRPHLFVVLDKIPRSSRGKILKESLLNKLS